MISKVPFDQATIMARLRSEIASQREYSVQYWPIFLRMGGDLVGCCGLHMRDAAKKIYELGFHLRPAFWGKGFATEAALAVIAFGFSQMNASALFAGHHPENEGSRKTLLKLGFRKTHEELYAPTDLMHPAYLLAAL